MASNGEFFHRTGFWAYAGALISLVFPHLCLLCARDLLKHEVGICRICAGRLPRTQYHQLPSNAVERIFWGRVPVSRATALFFYRKDEQVKKILHAIKYKGDLALGEEMGRMMGVALLECDWGKEIDLIVPVPLHPRKLRMRGYNQSELIAKGLSGAMNVPVVPNALVRRMFTSTQTQKGRFERFQNMSGVFELKDAAFVAGKHILLVDDVVTTGGTIEACAQCLVQAPGTRVSVATLAYAVL